MTYSLSKTHHTPTHVWNNIFEFMPIDEICVLLKNGVMTRNNYDNIVKHLYFWINQNPKLKVQSDHYHNYDLVILYTYANTRGHLDMVSEISNTNKYISEPYRSRFDLPLETFINIIKMCGDNHLFSKFINEIVKDFTHMYIYYSHNKEEYLWVLRDIHFALNNKIENDICNYLKNRIVVQQKFCCCNSYENKIIMTKNMVLILAYRTIYADDDNNYHNYNNYWELLKSNIDYSLFTFEDKIELLNYVNQYFNKYKAERLMVRRKKYMSLTIKYSINAVYVAVQTIISIINNNGNLPDYTCNILKYCIIHFLEVVILFSLPNLNTYLTFLIKRKLFNSENKELLQEGMQKNMQLYYDQVIIGNISVNISVNISGKIRIMEKINNIIQLCRNEF